MRSVGIRIMLLSRALTSYHMYTKTLLERLAILTSLSEHPEANDTLLPTWGSCPMPRVMKDASNPDISLYYEGENRGPQNAGHLSRAPVLD